MRRALRFHILTKVYLERVKKNVASARSFRRNVFWLIALWFVTFAALAAVYQIQIPSTLNLATSDWLYANGLLKGFYPRQGNDAEHYRFTDGNANITLLAPGATTPLEITYLMNAWRPDRAGEIDFSLNGKFIKRAANFEWRTHRAVLDETVPLDPNTLVIGIASDTFSPQEYDPDNPDPSTLGVRVQSITLTPKTNSFVTPSWIFIFAVALLVSACFLLYAKFNLARLGIFLSFAAIGVFAFLIIFYRYTAATYFIPITALLVVTILFVQLARGASLSKIIFTGVMLGIILLTFGSRLQLATQLPGSIDELTYIPVSQRYANNMERGRWNQIVRFKGNIEHPLFTKLSFAAAMVAGRAAGITNDLFSARFVSVAITTLLAALLAVLNPFAGIFFGLHTIQAQYSSLTYLEAMPAFTSTFAIVAFERAARHSKRWLFLSALMLGLTAASKYIYLVAGFAILPFLLWQYRRYPLQILLYGAITLGVFFLANPILWDDPLRNIMASLNYHLAYSASQGVTHTNRAWYWHLLYLARVDEWSNGFAFPPDALIFVLGFVGLPFLWRTRKIYLVWFLVALVFLLLWRTKWEQYALILITPLCLSAGFGLNEIARRVRTRVVRTLNAQRVR